MSISFLRQQSYFLYDQMKTDVMLLISNNIHLRANSGQFNSLILSDCDSDFETKKLRSSTARIICRKASR